MAMNEAQLQAKIRLEAHTKDAVLWRNNTGKLKDKNGRWVEFGLCVGSSDLIGFTEQKITQDMVGSYVAVFTAVEVKSEIKPSPTTKEQKHFVDSINSRGGIAGVVNSLDDFQRLFQASE